jgi:hypothetical protein
MKLVVGSRQGEPVIRQKKGRADRPGSSCRIKNSIGNAFQREHPTRQLARREEEASESPRRQRKCRSADRRRNTKSTE